MPALDLPLFQLVHSFVGISSIVDWSAVVVAQYLPYAVACFVLYIILQEKEWKRKVWAFLVLAFSLLVSRGFIVGIIHYFYARPRPFLALGFDPLFIHESSSAFPSTHALVLTTLAYVTFMFDRRAGWWLFGFALLNGLARVYAGVHWPLDIVGGMVLAFVCTWATLKLFPEAAYHTKHEEASSSID